MHTGYIWRAFHYHEWIQFEVDYAKQKNKPIVAIKPRGNVIMPKEITDVADEVVNWNTDSIVTAIRNNSL